MPKVFCRTAAFPSCNVGRRAAANAKESDMKDMLNTPGLDDATSAVQEHPGSLAENARDPAQEPLAPVREH